MLNATSGPAAMAALARKVLIDVPNPLDFSRGTPPTLDPVNTDSLGEQIQRAFPAVRVVKAQGALGHADFNFHVPHT